MTTRPARPSDAETLARTARPGMDTWRAFAPAGWTPRPFADSVAFTRRLLAAPGAWALLADVAGEPAGVAEAAERRYPLAWLSVPARHARARRFYEGREWRADTLLERTAGCRWRSTAARSCRRPVTPGRIGRSMRAYDRDREHAPPSRGRDARGAP